jgi:hypothetical protein
MLVLMETDLMHTFPEIFGATQNFNFHPHEINRQVPSVQFGESDRIFLSGEDDFSLADFAAVDDIENLLLGEAVMVCEAFGIDNFRT